MERVLVQIVLTNGFGSFQLQTVGKGQGIHADELHDICHALEDEGKAEAAAALAEALHAFDHGNDKLEKALELAKQA